MYRHDPLYWESFWVNLKSAVRQRDPRVRLRLDVAISILILVTISISLFRLGASPSAWKKNWPDVIVLVVAAEIVSPLVKPAIKLTAALHETCKKPRFREVSSVVVIFIVFEMAWFGNIWHGNYIKSPHFELTIVEPLGISNIPDYPGMDPSYPVSDLFIPKIILSNKYAPSKTHDWKVIATFPSGETATGYLTPYTSTVNHQICSPSVSIYRDFSSTWIRDIGNGNRVTGCADFIFKMVDSATLREPGTIFNISFRDSHDTLVEKSVKWPATIRRIPDSEAN